MGRSVRRDVGKRAPQVLRATDDSSLRWFKEEAKADTLVLSKVRAQLMRESESKQAERDTEHLHASEISKSGWCPRASWYALLGTEPDKAKKVDGPNLIT